ncbi:MAG: IPT/TIG domain-containing protein [Deltaproteobacteria bacterium]|nr:IPT/TIG domain-containing protein [Deltaproteobacteria bacterium]
MASTPDFGPLVGGTRIQLTGTGFLGNGAAPNRVLIGGREAPLASALSDTTLEVELPPGEMPGDAPIVVFNHVGQGTATGVFHYSTPPTVGAITPAEVLYTVPNTRMTVTGSGFMDEGAGFVRVFLDGQQAVDVEVLSDTQLTFTAIAAAPLTRPDVKIVNERGEGVGLRAFRFVPSTRKGLLLFPTNETFFFFYDPVDQSILTVPRLASSAGIDAAIMRSVTTNADGELYGQSKLTNQFGRIDFRTQQVVEGVQQLEQYRSFARIAEQVFAFSRNSSFGSFDLSNGRFTKIGSSAICCQSISLAGTTVNDLVFTNDQFITPITATGVVGTPIALNPVRYIRDMRFLDTTLFAISRNPVDQGRTDLITIVPGTGATTVVKSFDNQITAMEVFQ